MVKRIQPLQKAFTLVEMLVVLAIISMVMIVTLLSSNQFNQSIILVDTAHSVAMSIREAQTFGISTKQFSGVQDAGYGVSFTSSKTNGYTLFADIYPAKPGDSLSGKCPLHTPGADAPDQRPGNCLYNITQNEKVNDVTLPGNYSFSSVCGRVSASARYCLGTDLTAFDIVYIRPNTETVIIGTNGASTYTLSDACIIVKAPGASGATKSIYVSKVGQIAVVSTCP